MSLFPKLYYKDVPSIRLDDLKHLGVKGLVLDVDNTLIDYQKVMKEDVQEWTNRAKAAGFQICILSNSNNIEKVSRVADVLAIPYILSASKPMKKGYRKVMEKLALPAKEIAVIGDQVFTDVWGANRMKMVSVYVEPINQKEFWYTKWKRPLEKMVLKLAPKNTK